MTYDTMCELVHTARRQGYTHVTGWSGDTVDETVTIWYEPKRRWRAEAQRMEPVPAHKRGTFVTEYGKLVWEETDKRIISAPTIKQLVRKLTEEGEYRL